MVIEDGPTITHGDMAYGAGFVAAQDLAAEIIDPRKFATPNIAAVYRRYPHIGPVLPAVGYDEAQRFELERTIARSDAATIGLISRIIPRIETAMGPDVDDGLKHAISEIDHVRPFPLAAAWLERLLDRVCPVPNVRKRIHLLYKVGR